MEHHIYFLGDALGWRLSTVDESSLVTALFSLSSLSSLLGDRYVVLVFGLSVTEKIMFWHVE